MLITLHLGWSWGHYISVGRNGQQGISGPKICCIPRISTLGMSGIFPFVSVVGVSCYLCVGMQCIVYRVHSTQSEQTVLDHTSFIHILVFVALC